MSSDTRPAARPSSRGRSRDSRDPGDRRRRSSQPAGPIRRLTAGGTDGNERLTVLTGLMLVVLLAILGVTIVRIGQLLWLHLFLGLLLLGPVALKLLSTGYRFVRYYTGACAYRRKGPPATPLRVLGPLVVLSTLAVFVTGVALLLLGPGSRQPWVLLHKISFFAWIAVTALHVLGHLPEIGRYLSSAQASRRELVASPEAGGAGGRGAAMGVALLLGLVLALSLLSQFGAWTG